MSFAESSFFPIPPDVLLIALVIGKPAGAFRFAFVCSAASVLGGLFGYLIGWGFWQSVDQWFFAYVPGFTEAWFVKVCGYYESWNFWIVFFAAFTPIPYKVITVTAGVTGVSLLPFIIASVVGRSLRFYLVSALLWKFGAPMKAFIDKYFDWLSLLFFVLLAAGFAVIKYLL